MSCICLLTAFFLVISDMFAFVLCIRKLSKSYSMSLIDLLRDAKGAASPEFAVWRGPQLVGSEETYVLCSSIEFGLLLPRDIHKHSLTFRVRAMLS